MAEESDGGIIQMVELRLDMATAQSLKAAIQTTLNDGTKSDAAVSNIKKVENALGGVKAVAKELMAIMGELGLILGFAEIIRKVVEANAEYEHLKVQLQAFTGSAEGAARAMEALEDIQRSVPVTLRDLTAAYITLKNVGINPSSEQMLHFANIAAALGKTVDEVANAVAMSTLGMTRGLRQFGIQAVVDGDKLKLTFRGVTTEIANNAKSIVDYLDDIGKNKFGDAGAAQANTLGGAWTMLKSAFDRLFEAVGEDGFAGALIDALHWLTDLVDEMAKAEQATSEFGAQIDTTATLVKTVFIVAWQLVAATFDVVVGTLQEALGVLEMLTGEFDSGSKEIAAGLDRISTAGGRVAAVFKAMSDAEDHIQASRQHVLVAHARHDDERDSLGNLPGSAAGGLGDGSASTTGIGRKGSADEAQKVLELQTKLIDELQKEADEREKIAGITNVQIGNYEKRLAIIRQESTIVQKQEATLAQQLKNGNLSDAARKIVVDKLQLLVLQSKALQDEAARLLDAIRLRQPLAATNANNVPGAGGGLNAGVDAANRAQSINGDIGIMGMHGGLTPEQWADRGNTLIEQHAKIVDKATNSVNRYAGAWINAFVAIGSGKNVFKELEKAIFGTLAAIAQKEADEQIAKGVADLAEGTWPPNPAALEAAGKHFAAAALFEVLAGAAGSVGQGGGSGGGSASTGTSRGANASAPIAPNVTVVVNAFDKNNPIDQNMLGDAIVPYIERTGNKVVIGGKR